MQRLQPPAVVFAILGAVLLLSSWTMVQGQGGLSASEVAAAQESVHAISEKLGLAEWLGPLAPIALSPFFGIALLSGLSLFGAGRFGIDNAFIGPESPLSNPLVFWGFLALALATSLPRLTKVSKPLAQAVDQLEAYAGIITLFALRLLTGGEPDTEVSVVQAGLFTTTLDGALMVAAAINVFVINAVKFFFEVLIWITPIPFVDALFEAANKGVCAGLVAVYAWSPAVATVINLSLLAICLLVFRWMYRRQVYYRTILYEQLRAWVTRTKVLPEHLTVFPKDDFEPFQDRARCRFERTDDGWRLTQRRLLRAPLVLELPAATVTASVDRGLFTNTLSLRGADSMACDCSFGRRYNDRLVEVAERLQLALEDSPPKLAQRGLKAEMG